MVSTTSFTDFDDAIAIANDTLYGLAAGVWMLAHYQHTKNLLVRYDPKPMGFF